MIFMATLYFPNGKSQRYIVVGEKLDNVVLHKTCHLYTPAQKSDMYCTEIKEILDEEGRNTLIVYQGKTYYKCFFGIPYATEYIVAENGGEIF
jgi:hypothetical protein